MKPAYMLLFIILLSACAPQAGHQYPQQILGKWQFVKYGKLNEDRMGNPLIKTEIALTEGLVYDFASNNVCTYRGEAFVFADTSFSAHQGQYEFNGDSLGVADAESKQMHWVKIAYMDADTMIVYCQRHFYAKAAKLK